MVAVSEMEEGRERKELDSVSVDSEKLLRGCGIKESTRWISLLPLRTLGMGDRGEVYDHMSSVRMLPHCCVT